ncbi:MAG: DUF2225 domain-containing protein [Candidatus Helarchaeota archaeon]
MTTIALDNFKCPICDHEFEAYVLASFSVCTQRTDFRPNYGGLTPVKFQIKVCPKCGFSAENYFYDSEIENSEFKTKIKEEFKPVKNYDDGDYSLEEKLERVIKCYKLMKLYNIGKIDDYYMGNLYLTAYYWIRNREKVMKYGELAIKKFQDALKSPLLKEEEIWRLRYLIAEINRRIGNIDEALTI